jgi:hypothetical protein
MTTIHADFNALTEDRSICLTTRGSQDDIRKHGVQAGDRIWLSDGELLVEAEVAEDARYGLIGIPSWETMVELDADSTPDGPGTTRRPDPRFRVGEPVRVLPNEQNRSPHVGTIDRVIWHHEDARYNYYIVEKSGGRLSKRYLSEDLEAVET